MSKINLDGRWRHILLWCRVSLFVVLTILVVVSFQVEAQGNGAITGKVTGDNNVPLANVVVRAYYKESTTGINWVYRGQAATDDTGAYTIPTLNAGIYHISFNEYPPTAEYMTEFYNNASSQEGATEIQLGAGATVNNINAQLSSGAHIKGQVTDLQGNPLDQIVVYVVDNNDSASNYDETDINGNYELRMIHPGSYRVAFDDVRSPRLYRRGYFNNVIEKEKATVIPITVDQMIDNMNIQLHRLGFVTGTVTDGQNNPLSTIQVTAQQRTSSGFVEAWQDVTSTDAAGHYRLGGLQEGVYRIRFHDQEQQKYSREYYNNAFDQANATLLTVTLNTTITNINAQLDLHGGITGRVTNQRGEPLQDVVVTAVAQGINSTGSDWDDIRYTSTNANGDYNLCCLDGGPYRLRFDEQNNLYVDEYYDNIYFDFHLPYATPTLVQVTPNLTTTGINAELIPYSRLISHVIDQRGQPISGLKLTVYRYVDTQNGGWLDNVIWPEIVDDTYQYSVIPGRYRIYFEDNRYLKRYKDEFYDNAADLPSATDIVVTEQATVTIEAVLADKARIDGRVTDPNGNPAPDIIVSAWQPPTLPAMPWQQVSNTTTDQNGDYSLSGLKPGTYRVGFAIRYPPGPFAGEFYNNVSTIEAATDLVVNEDVATLEINAQLGRPNQIGGQVTTITGSPLTDIAVVFYRYLYIGNYRVQWKLDATTQTDGNGLYQSPELAPGLYRVGFQDSNNIYHSVFYNNASCIENGTTLTLTTDTTTTGINAQLPANPFTWPPYAQDDQIVVVKGGTASTLHNGMRSVLTNDCADNSGFLTANLITMPAHGLLSFHQDGTFTYTHNGDEATSDFFTYTNNDSSQQSNLAQVTITIQPINNPLVARNDSLTVARGQRSATLDSGAKSLLANDSAPDSAVLIATLKNGPAHGTVTIQANGAFTYTHDNSAGDSDSFTYQATDALGSSAVATVTVAINPFTFSKTVSIAGIKPLCTPVAELRVPVGTTIVYCYTIHNLGDIPLTTHTLVDSHLGSLLTNHSHPVAAGAAFSVTFTQTLTISTTNIATWTATSPAEQGLTAVSPSATAKKAATVLIASATDDSDGDGIPDNLEKAGDIDGDNLPNFLDTDADGDGKLDKEEAGSNPAQPLDSNQNGVPDYLENQSGTLKQQKLFLPVINR